MFGAVVDQHVFDALVMKYLPLLGEHFKKKDIQIAVACLPWFLSLYMNTFPLHLALRVIDWFCQEGPRVLFQIGLAILKLAGEGLLKSRDDGELMGVFKSFFGSLEDLAYPNHPNPKSKQFSVFNQLLLVAYKEFQMVTNESIMEMRKLNQPKVIHGIGDFAKKTAIRNIADKVKFTKEQLGVLYDRFQSLIFYDENSGKKGSGQRISLDQFTKFMAMTIGFCDFSKSARKNEEKEKCMQIGQTVLQRWFQMWDTTGVGSLSYPELVNGLYQLYKKDVLAKCDLLFHMQDEANKGHLTNDDIIQLSELFLFFYNDKEEEEEEQRHLSAVSNLLRIAFQQMAVDSSPSQTLSMSEWRAIVLAEPVITSFLETGFADSFGFDPNVKLTSSEFKRYAIQDWLGTLTTKISKKNKSKMDPPTLLMDEDEFLNETKSGDKISLNEGKGPEGDTQSEQSPSMINSIPMSDNKSKQSLF